jgi:outer membrane protein assembly factor BamE
MKNLLMRNKKLVIATLTAAMLLSTGCVYRIDVPQGNFVEQKQIEQLRAGMSRAQVEYVLGSPMVEDAFDTNTWHYVYYLREGWNDPKQKDLTVRFVNDKLAQVSGDYPAPANFNRPL